MILEARLKAISRLLSLFATQIKTDVAMGFLDKNRVAEDVLIPLFSVIYGYENLRNLNERGDNFPSIDLGDETAKVAFQISSSVDSTKIKETLEKFIKYKHFEAFEHLIFYDLIEKQVSYAGTGWDAIRDEKFTFSKETDIRDHTDLAAQIRRRPLDKVKEVHGILQKHFGSTALDFSIAAPSPDLMKSLHQLRPTLPDFTGREEQIDVLKEAAKTNHFLFGLHGMGGVGKTELALALANELAPEFPDAQLFISLQTVDGQPRPLNDVLSQCIESLTGTDLRTDSPRNEEHFISLFQSAFHGKRTVTILDNAESRDQVAKLIPGGEHLVIITSRSAIPVPGIRSIELGTFTPDQACQLITSICPRLDADRAYEICELCAYLPLAVRAAGSLLSVLADMDVSDYVSDLRDERVRLEKIGTEGVELGVAATFNLSYRKLSVESARIFRGLCIFPDTFTAQAEAYITEDIEHRNLSDLVRRSLAIFDQNTTRYSLHPLVRLFAKGLLETNELGAVERRFAKYFVEVLKQSNSMYLAPGATQEKALRLFGDEKANIIQGFEIVRQVVDRDPTRLELSWAYLVLASQILMDRLPPQQLIEWATHVRENARIIKNEGAELGPLTVIGLSLQGLGELDRAIPIFERSIEIARQVGDNQTLAYSLDYLGRIYNEKGQPHRAIDLFKESKDTFHSIDRHLDERRPMTDLAIAYAKVGDTNTAIYYLEQVIEEARDVKNRFEEANGLANLAMVSEVSNKAKTAELAEEAARIYFDIGFTFWYAKALSTAASAYIAIGETDMGFQLLDQAEQILREKGDILGTALTIGKRGNALADLGRYDEALVEFDRQLEIGNNIGSLEAQSNALGSKCIVFKKQKDYVRSELMGQAALEVDRKSGNLQNQFITLCHIGESYLESGDLQKALAIFEEQLAITKIQAFGKNVLHSYEHLASTLLRDNKPEQALKFLAESVEWSKTTPDPHDHPAALFQLAEFELKTGRQGEVALTAAKARDGFRAIGDESCALKAESFIKLHEHSSEH